MPKIAYTEKGFHGRTLAVIEKANEIISEYEAEGYTLTLRQLYYQFVARALMENTQSEYNRLGNAINDARLAGLIDWEAITDRTRQSRGNTHFDNPAEILDVAARGYRIDTRADQHTYLEVWVEKDALLDVVGQACQSLDVPYFSCRGYVSQSAMWEAAQRMIEQEKRYRETEILHLGDHDPSGLDMTRDIQDRMELFGTRTFVERIALTMDQIEQYRPPPNPAKLTDTRSDAYITEYGDQSWELDSLDPRTIVELIEYEVDERTVETYRQAKIEAQERDRERLAEVAAKWGQA